MNLDVSSSEEQLEEQAEKLAVLVPIQIDIDVDTFKIRDSFTWNLNGNYISLFPRKCA